MRKCLWLNLAACAAIWAQGEAPFTAAQSQRVGTAESMAAGDFDNDGIDDLATIDAGKLVIRFGAGQRPLEREAVLVLPGLRNIQTLADLNNDGKLDALVLRTDPARGVQSLLLPGRGDGTFNAGLLVPLESCVIRATGDFNRDGLMDAACANQAQPFYTGTGGGMFAPGPVGPPLATRDRPAFAAGDFNRDGFPDLVSLTDDSLGVQFWWSDARLNLRRGIQAALPRRPLCVAVSDTNRDGQPEVYSIPQGSAGSVVTQITKITSSSFELRPLFSAEGINGEGCLATDFNGDGAPDLLASSYSVAYVSSRAGYYPSPRLPIALGGQNATTGDFDGDGKPDLILGGDRGRVPFPVTLYINSLAASSVRLLPPSTPIGPAQAFTLTAELISPVAGVTPQGAFEILSSTDGRVLARSNAVALLPAARWSNGWLSARALINLNLPAGRNALRARYVGDANFNPGPSREITLLVTKGQLSFARATDDPYVENTPLTLDLRANGSANGEVRLEANGQLLAAAAMRNGAVQLNLGPQPAGLRRMTLTFAGDTAWEALRQDLEIRVARSWRVASAATGLPAIAPDSLAAGYGIALADFPASSAGALELAGSNLKIMDARGQSVEAPLLYASPTQVNFYVPTWAAAGKARAIITRRDGDMAVTDFTIDAVAPGLFTAPGGIAPAALVVRAGSVDYAFTCTAGLCRPKPIAWRPGEPVVISFFATGLRGARPESIVVEAGGVSLPVTYAGPQSEVPGLQQINAVVPDALRGRGELALRVTAAGIAANTVRLHFE